MYTANNRFLQRVNPQISRALTDGGSSLDHPEVQRLAQQMVDMGIWENLIAWISPTLIKTFVGGNPSVTRINKCFDISGNNKDFVTWPYVSNSNPLLGNLSDKPLISNTTAGGVLAFEGSVIPNSDNYSIILWANVSSGGSIISSGGSSWSTQLHVNNYFFVTGGTQYNVPISNSQLNQWTMYAVTRNGSSYRVRIYNVNGTFLSTLTRSGSYRGSNQTMLLGLKLDNSNNITNTSNASIGDCRVFDSVLTDAQIEAIFNETRGKYGL